MAKRRNRQNRAAPQTNEVVESMRRAHWTVKVAVMAEGRRERASTFADRRKVASKRACRDRRYW